MKKFNFGNFFEALGYHGSILVRGIARTLYGALIAGLIGISVYGFVSIRNEAGYIAVFDFIAACATLAVALSNMYMLGVVRKKGKK
jgi:hypothetical protein